MTDEEAAAAVQEGLAGIHRCPDCGEPMEEVWLIGFVVNGVKTEREQAWVCRPCEAWAYESYDWDG